VDERLVQKRDYLAWHNVILLLFDAMLLAGFVMLLFLGPFLMEIDPTDSDSLQETFSATFILVSLIIQDGILIWMVWHQVVQRRVIPLPEMGISKKQISDGPQMAKWTVLGLLIGLGLFAIAFAIELFQNSLGFAPPDESVIGPVEGNTSEYLIWLISGCIIAPISEEFFFRGYAFYAFDKKYGLAIGVFVSAMGFAVVHTNIYALLPIFIAGIGLALAYYYTKSLVPPIIAHAVKNFIALTLMYTGVYG
jgi:membrane protease YdiL (CAAX protease family)